MTEWHKKCVKVANAEAQCFCKSRFLFPVAGVGSAQSELGQYRGTQL